MNCEQFLDNLDDWLDGDLQNGRLADFLEHLGGCKECRREATLGHDLLRELRASEVPPMPEDLAARLLRNAKPARYLPVQFAAAACLMLAVLGGLYFGVYTSSVDRPQQWVTLELAETSEVTLALSSAEAISGATLTLDLPDGVELDGYPDQRQLRWVASLEKGNNKLRLPLVASQAPRGDLVLKIQHGSKMRTLRIGVRAGESSQSTHVVDPDLSKKAT